MPHTIECRHREVYEAPVVATSDGRRATHTCSHAEARGRAPSGTPMGLSRFIGEEALKVSIGGREEGEGEWKTQGRTHDSPKVESRRDLNT